LLKGFTLLFSVAAGGILKQTYNQTMNTGKYGFTRDYQGFFCLRFLVFPYLLQSSYALQWSFASLS
jgi:hypothetical protein